ncbi:dihydroorotate dehydrogenase electron transfer subunit [Gimesia aquarii]|uniref:Dihydroorotate dehydrogenase B (NAD(+)), electron transfer subunit n=1 Tax=Gimesia aquarii TaxID=2527964 RepID=A0A517VVE3_9PLAN|nr:dihydroorotate dehydrogenase electron transfer subunit [Gimesia aquarii]QDT96965.1 Dihydroorotate dehydrogenase B (NAD(+)), electron transfer subunit [Gimesia aquarii]
MTAISQFGTCNPPEYLSATVVEQEQMAQSTYRIRLDCPQLAKAILPGQFFMVREPGVNDPLLGRPFALYDTYLSETGQPLGVDFGYVIVGKLTTRMTHWQPGDQVELWGPLGNGFPRPGVGALTMVAGGIGQTPFLAAAREALAQREYGERQRTLDEFPEKVSLLYGARSKDYLAGLDDFNLNGLDVEVATDDGSFGHHGYVTELLQQQIKGPTPPATIFCCGPEPMMEAVSQIAIESNISCWLSLETPMACGFGACFSCVAKVRISDNEWDYRRTCVEGPVFKAEDLIF